jgi:hypothetical protein
LGGIIAKQPSQATHLVVNNLDRTGKLLKCLNFCEYVVDLSWLLDSKLEKNFLGELRKKKKCLSEIFDDFF